MRKLWFARVLVLLAAVALMAVVIEERDAQEAKLEPLQSICWSQAEAQGYAEGPRLDPSACTDTRPARAPSSR